MNNILFHAKDVTTKKKSRESEIICVVASSSSWKKTSRKLHTRAFTRTCTRTRAHRLPVVFILVEVKYAFVPFGSLNSAEWTSERTNGQNCDTHPNTLYSISRRVMATATTASSSTASSSVTQKTHKAQEDGERTHRTKSEFFFAVFRRCALIRLPANVAATPSGIGFDLFRSLFLRWNSAHYVVIQKGAKRKCKPFRWWNVYGLRRAMKISNFPFAPSFVCSKRLAHIKQSAKPTPSHVPCSVHIIMAGDERHIQMRRFNVWVNHGSRI